MGWEMLLVISPRQFSSSSLSRALPSCLSVVLGCAGDTCAAAIAYRGFVSCRSPAGRQLSCPGGCSAHFPHQHEPSPLCSPSHPRLIPRPCRPQ